MARTWRARVLVAGAFALTLCVSLPLAIALRAMIAAHLGASLAADSLSQGVNYEWWQEFLAQATGLGSTFVPSIIGFGGVLLNISNLVDDAPLATTIAGAVAAWLVIWSFLSGGFIDRLARDRAVRAQGFFSACGAHAGALIRLGLLALVAYAVLFAWVHPLLFDSLFPRWTREMDVERSAFAVRLALYILFGLGLIAVNLLIDYARVRIVVEDRRSALGAVRASARFIISYPGAVLSTYLWNSLLFLALLLAYAAAAPRATSPVVLTLVVGELYIVARHFLKLAFYASEVALFQSRLAHAGYTASPPRVWPESPEAEGIANGAGVRLAS